MKRRVLATLLALCTALAMLPGTALAATGTLTGTFNGHAYQVFDVSLNWADAQQACEKAGGHLVTITSAQEQAFVESLVANGTKAHYWLGGTDAAREGVWQWVTGEPFVYKNWSRSQPDNFKGHEDYLQMFKASDYSRRFGTWNDIAIDCKSTNSNEIWYSMDHTGYICEWENSKVTITFNANGGACSTKTKKVTVNAAYGALPTPTLTGYTFSGWYTAQTGGKKVTASTKATANATLYAHWTKKSTAASYTLTFNANGGICSTASKKVNANAVYGTLPEAHRTGYTLSGWYTAKSGGKKVTASTTATANATLYARWAKARRMYQVNFNPNGGDVLRENKTVVRGSTYQALPTPTRPGYHFTGWYTKSSGGTKITDRTKVSLTANQTLYAHWSTAAVKATSVKTGNWKISIPNYYNVMLYSSNISASPASYIPEKGSGTQTLTCTKMASLSNGTTRYYTRLASGKYYWFTYTCEMDVN